MQLTEPLDYNFALLNITILYKNVNVDRPADVHFSKAKKCGSTEEPLK